VIVLQRDRTPFPASLIDRLPRLRYLVFTGTRNTTLDFEALHRRGIPVSCSGRAATRDGTCEIAWALMLAAAKQLESRFAVMRAGGWRGAEGVVGSLAGERIGLIGLGDIGRQMARIALAFGMEVVAWSPHMTAERAAESGCTSVPLEELLSTSKVVSLHIVPSEATHRLLDAQRLALMRTDAILVNTARAELVDAEALVQALQAGRPGAAALDVYDMEPLEGDHPLRRQHNAVLTPHVGFVTAPVMEVFARGTVECVAAWLRGEPLPRTFAPPAP
jgi:phosphoglycerate dehydrogenase-like enzyme